MKKIIALIIGMTGALSLKAANNTAKLTELINIIQKQKNGWLDYAAAYQKAKFDLIKKQNNDLFNLKKHEIQKFQKDSNVSDLMQVGLIDMLKLHKQDMLEWKKLNENYGKKAGQISNKYNQEISNFESSIGQIKRTYKTPSAEFTEPGQVPAILESSEPD